LNYLAHLFLSRNEPQIMVGNFIADFVRSSQTANFPEKIKEGIALHHQIDHYTDTHAMVQQSKDRLRPEFGKYAGVIVDVFYDHFLSIHWEKFTTQNRLDFCKQAYTNLQNNFVYLPPPLQAYLPELIEKNWLYFYASFEGVRRALTNLSNRSVHRKDLPKALDTLKTDYNGFEEDFLIFFPDLYQNVNHSKVL
jgi:acyl carrier protein phosphodiesterase